MPLLTPDTLADLARRTRRYLHGTDIPPATTSDFYDRVRPDDRRVVVLVYGPATPPMPPSPYRSLYAVGLMDVPKRADCGYQIVGVQTIEEHLAEVLRKQPPEEGYDLVVVPVPPGVSDVWAHAERTDADARRCAGMVAAVNRSATGRRAPA